MLYYSNFVIIVTCLLLSSFTCGITYDGEYNIPYKEVFRSLPSAAVIMRPDLVVLDANDEYFDLTQNSRNSIIGQSVDEIASDLTNDDSSLQTMKQTFSSVLTEKKSGSYDFLDKNNRIWNTQVHPVFIPTYSETLALMLCQVTDHTALHQERNYHHFILEQLQHIDNYRRLVDAVRPYGIFMVDESGIVRHWSKGASTLTGWNEEEVIGKHVFTFYSSADYYLVHERMQKTSMEDSISLLQETTVLKKDESWFLAESTITPIFLNQDTKKQIGHAFVIRDMTKEIAAQEELRIAYEQAAVLKDEFTRRCSHDIRTPLNAISLAADALYATKMTPEQTELVYLIKRSVKKQLVHVNEILDFGKLTSPNRKLSLHLENTDIVKFLQVEVDDFKLIAPPEIDVLFKYPHDLPSYMVDQNKLQQITANLISNALKFTAKGSVSLEITLDKEDNKTAINIDTVKLIFSDTGQGISAANLKTLFVPYTQVDGSNTQGNRGSGLGLSIVKIVTEDMSGTVEMTSPGEGQGTCVVVKLPLLRSQSRPPLQRTPTSAMDVTVAGDGNQKLIVAEDDDVNRRLLVRGLKRLGYNYVDEVSNGQELVQMVKVHVYDLLITDVSMPLLSGIDAAQQIRKYDQKTPIIALTADGTQIAINQCLSAGINHVLIKPARIKDIGKLLAEILKK